MAVIFAFAEMLTLAFTVMLMGGFLIHSEARTLAFQSGKLWLDLNGIRDVRGTFRLVSWQPDSLFLGKKI